MITSQPGSYVKQWACSSLFRQIETIFKNFAAKTSHLISAYVDLPIAGYLSPIRRIFSAFKIFPLLPRLPYQMADDDDFNG